MPIISRTNKDGEHVDRLLRSRCGHSTDRKELEHPYIGPKLAEALRGSEISAVDRIRIFRQISERFLTEWGSRHEGSLREIQWHAAYLINLLTMQRTEYQVDGPLPGLPGRFSASEIPPNSEGVRRRPRRRRTTPAFDINRAYATPRTFADGYIGDDAEKEKKKVAAS